MRSLTLALLLVSAAASHAADKMNVLFVVSDDLAARALGCYGNPICKSPNLDGLAANGVRFNHAYCQYPLCNPSRASFLTGLRPDQTGVVENATHFRKNVPDVQTLPQTFRKAGYFVARVGKLYHYGVPKQIGTDGLDDPPSWETVVNPRGRDVADENKIFSLTPGQFGGTLSWLAADGEDVEQTDAIGAAATVQLIEENKDKPFFLACGFYRPHTPYVAPKNYFDMYPEDKMPLPDVASDHWQSAPALAFASHNKSQDKLTDPLRREAIQAYYASTTFMDARFGELTAALKKNGLAEKTIVVFFSDHGYHLGDHGLWQKQSVFENSARVPLLIYDPRAKGNGKVCGRPVELIDLHPTLADLCGLTPPNGLPGKSLRPLLDDPSAEWAKPAISQVRHALTEGGKKGRPVMGYSVRDGRYRYTEWDAGKAGVQLYDYESDADELHNLATLPDYRKVVERMKAMLPTAQP